MPRSVSKRKVVLGEATTAFLPLVREGLAVATLATTSDSQCQIVGRRGVQLNTLLLKCPFSYCQRLRVATVAQLTASPGDRQGRADITMLSHLL
jgi:hypothetical protein